jgi:hypothetical protein
MDRCITERKDIFLRVWPLIIEVARDGPVHEILLQAIFHLEKRIAWMGASLVKQPWKERVLRLGPPGIEDAAKGAAAYFKRGGPKVFARGLRDALNHGTRKRLMFEGQSDEDDD